jgi:hypothetical protein
MPTCRLSRTARITRVPTMGKDMLHGDQLYDTNTIARFWSKADVCRPDKCWSWKAGMIPQGYGSFWLEGKSRRASCVAWEIANNKRVPDGNIICHHCDNRACVNPAHLYVGTWKSNAQDRETRGRSHRPCGENHANSKLTTENVIEIRRLYDGRSWKLNDLADRYHVSFQHISDIIHRRKWEHV